MPMVFGTVYTQDEQQVFWSQGTHWQAQEDNRLKALPQACQIKWEIERRGRNSPVEFDKHLAIAAHEFIHLTLARKQGVWPLLPPAVALGQ